MPLHGRHGTSERGNSRQRRERRWALLADPRFQGTLRLPGKRAQKTVPGQSALCMLRPFTPKHVPCEGIVTYATMQVDQREPGGGYGGKRDGYANAQPGCGPCNRWLSVKPKIVRRFAAPKERRSG